MKLWWLVALVACKRSEPAKTEASGSAPIRVEVVDASAATMPGVPEASVASAPRANWPCALLGKTSDGSEHITRFEYPSDQPCKVPITEYEHTLGGCPSRVVSQGGGPDEVVYDDKRRLTEYYAFRYGWGDAGVRAKLIHEDQFPYSYADGVVSLHGAATVAEAYRLDAKGRLLVHEINGPYGAVIVTLKFDYEGDRPIRKTYVGSSGVPDVSEILYDCSKLPAPKP